MNIQSINHVLVKAIARINENQLLEMEPSKEDAIQMYQDVIEMLRSQGKPVPRKYINKLAQLQGGKSGEKWIYSDQVFGHPQATNLPKYAHLIPIKVKAGDTKTIERKIDQAQKVLDKLQQQWGKIDAIAKGRVRATPAQKKAAIKKMNSANMAEIETVIELLKNETMKELHNMHREAKKS